MKGMLLFNIYEFVSIPRIFCVKLTLSVMICPRKRIIMRDNWQEILVEALEVAA